MSLVETQGSARKMLVDISGAASTVAYQLPLGDQRIDLNTLIGKQIRLQAMGLINCVHCGRKTKKSFSQGYCYPCFNRCDY